MPVDLSGLFSSEKRISEEKCNTPISELHNNCVLVALKKVSGLPDKEIVKAAFTNGYVEAFGVYAENIPDIVRELNLTLLDRRSELQELRRNKTNTLSTIRAYNPKPPSLRKIKQSFPKGVYIIAVPGHCLTMIDGKIIDPNLPNESEGRKVLHLWRITKG